MIGRNSSALLKIAMTKHDISWLDLAARVERDEKVDAATALMLVAQLKDGGTCALVVAAAIISLIVDKQRVPA